MSLGIFKAQIVNIPDANFKAKLLQADVNNNIAENLAGNNFKIDANSDGEIQVSEAILVSKLTFGINSSTPIATVDGILSFVNLKTLNISEINQSGIANPNTIDLHGLPNLENVIIGNPVSGNTPGSVNLSDCPKLKTFNGNVGGINLLGCISLESLECRSSRINNSSEVMINFQQIPDLKKIVFDNINLSNMNWQGLSKLETLELTCPQLSYIPNSISNIDLSSHIYLKKIYINYYVGIPNNYYYIPNDTLNLNSLNVEGCTQLEEINCKFGKMHLNFTGCTNLKYLAYDPYYISSLDLTNYVNIETLDLSFGDSFLPIFAGSSPTLTSLNVSKLKKLKNLIVTTQLLTTLDLGNNSQLQLLDVAGNHNLQTLYIKNGANENVSFYDNPNLTYVCCDDTQITQVLQNLVNSYGYTSCTVNSLCSVPVTIDLCTGRNTDGTLMSTNEIQDNDWQYKRPDGSIVTPVTRDVYTGWSHPYLADELQKSVWLAGVDDIGIEGYYTYTSKTFTIPADATNAKLNLRALGFVRNWVYLVKDNEDGTLTETEIAKTAYMSDGFKGWWNSRNPLVTDMAIAPGKYFIKEVIYYNNQTIRQSISVNANITYSSVNPSPIIGGFYSSYGTLGTQENIKAESLVIYPNPTSNFVTIKSDDTITSIQLLDVSGKIIHTNRDNKKEITLDISNYPAGTYLAKIDTIAGTVTKKIIKK